MSLRTWAQPPRQNPARSGVMATGRPAGELVEDAIAGYFNEIEGLRTMLDSRYDEIVNGKVQPLDGVEVCRLIRERAKARRKLIA